MGLPLCGHTYALFMAVHQRPSTWDLFSTWGQKTGAVRSGAPSSTRGSLAMNLEHCDVRIRRSRPVCRSSTSSAW